MSCSKYFELCTVCGELLLPPIYQCKEGHLFCECCQPKLDICPEKECELPVALKIRNAYLERQLQDKTFDCQYCCLKLSVLSFRNHAFDCLQRKQNLCSQIGLSCQIGVKLSEAIEHFKSEHELKGVEMEDHSTLIEILQGVTRFSLDSNKVRWKPHFIQIREKLFLLRTFLEPELQCVSWIVCFAGSHCSAENIFGMIRLSSVDLESENRILQWHGKVPTLHSQAFEERFRVHVSTLKQFNSASEKLNGKGEKFKWKIQVHIYYTNFVSEEGPKGDCEIETKKMVVVDDYSDTTGTSEQSTNTSTNDFIALIRTIQYHFKLFMETFQ